MNKLNYPLSNATPQTISKLRSLNIRQTLNGLRVVGNPQLITNLSPNDRIICIDHRYDRTFVFV